MRRVIENVLIVMFEFFNEKVKKNVMEGSLVLEKFVIMNVREEKFVYEVGIDKILVVESVK